MNYKIEKFWAKKKLVILLFINIKKTFDYILTTKFVKKIIILGINNNLIYWTWFFLIIQKV